MFNMFHCWGTVETELKMWEYHNNFLAQALDFMIVHVE